MSIYKLPYFGEIDISSLKEDYRTKVKIGQREIRLDINFEEKNTDKNTIEIIKNFLEQVEQFDKDCVKYYTQDFYDKGEADDHIEFYMEECFDEELAQMIDIKQSRENQKLQLLNKMELLRVGLYPNQKNEIGYYGVFDYSIKMADGEYCNQLLVVKTKERGELDHVTWES